MRTIRILEHISLDGVIQAPGGPEEDRDGGFAHGGWSAPFFDPAAGAAIVAAHGARFDLLLGRRTYDIFAGYWPHQSNPMADSLNAAAKHVATHNPGTLAWGPAQGLGRDIVAGVRAAKAADGPPMIVWGSSTLAPVLLEHRLADEVLLLVCPIFLGAGKRLFPAGAPPQELALVETRAAASGVLINTYRPNGPIRTGSFDDPPAT
ncbi:MAG: dihydrofolate reductase family protein [Rhodobacterales bacterium]|nr:dihydrofolate reductase family protein [Rhodobacterales bacterium]